jgi:4-hydroxy-3-methylbut-2-enyl diphosphate reductase IspH
VFSPDFGVVCQTNLSNRKVAWLVQQLRHRYQDARVKFLNTLSPAMATREEAFERILVDCDHAVIIGEPGESSCEALAEAALRLGKTAVVVPAASQIDPALRLQRKIAFTAGAFATDETVRSVALSLVGR